MLLTIMAVTTFVSTPWAASNVNAKLVMNFILMAKSVKVIMFLKPPPCDHHYISKLYQQFSLRDPKFNKFFTYRPVL